MLQKLLILFALIITLQVNPVLAQQGCEWTTNQNGTWYRCPPGIEPSNPPPPPGTNYTEGAGVGCIDPRFGGISTGCYCCSCNGTCGGGGATPSGNNCPIGYVYNECASGTNTCVPGEKWSNCKTGSDTRVWGQVPKSCRTETPSRFGSDCVGGYEPDWYNDCLNNRQVPSTCFQGKHF